jgi:hypothetical protein
MDFGFIFLNCFTYNKGDGATVSEAKNLQFFYGALKSHMPIKEVILDGILGTINRESFNLPLRLVDKVKQMDLTINDDSQGGDW